MRRWIVIAGALCLALPAYAATSRPALDLVVHVSSKLPTPQVLEAGRVRLDLCDPARAHGAQDATNAMALELGRTIEQLNNWPAGTVRVGTYPDLDSMEIVECK